MSDDIQKKIREELAALQSSKVAKKTDRELAAIDAYTGNKEIGRRVSEGLKAFNSSAKGKQIVKQRNIKTAKSKVWKEAQRKGAMKKYEEDLEYNKKRSASLRKTKGKECQTPYGVFDSAAAFNEQKLTTCSFADNMRMKPHLFYYTENGPGEPTYEDILYTPYGEFNKGNIGNTKNSGGKDRAFAAAKAAGDEHAFKYKDKYAWWNKMTKVFPEQYYIKNEVKREWPSSAE